jgi:hypothetical protein
MVVQLDRVNSQPSALQDYRDRIAELEHLLAVERARSAKFAALLNERTPSHTGPMQFNGRPVLTPAQVARQQRCSVSTVIRYVQQGRWEADTVPGSNRWLIYADQPFTPKRKAGQRN